MFTKLFYIAVIIFYTYLLGCRGLQAIFCRNQTLIMIFAYCISLFNVVIFGNYEKFYFVTKGLEKIDITIFLWFYIALFYIILRVLADFFYKKRVSWKDIDNFIMNNEINLRLIIKLCLLFLGCLNLFGFICILDVFFHLYHIENIEPLTGKVHILTWLKVLFKEDIYLYNFYSEAEKHTFISKYLLSLYNTNIEFLIKHEISLREFLNMFDFDELMRQNNLLDIQNLIDENFHLLIKRYDSKLYNLWNKYKFTVAQTLGTTGFSFFCLMGIFMIACILDEIKKSNS